MIKLKTPHGPRCETTASIPASISPLLLRCCCCRVEREQEVNLLLHLPQLISYAPSNPMLLHSATAAGGSYAEEGDCSAKYAKQCSGKVGKIPLEEKILTNCEAWHSPPLLIYLVSANGSTTLLLRSADNMEHKESICIATRKIFCQRKLLSQMSLSNIHNKTWEEREERQKKVCLKKKQKNVCAKKKQKKVYAQGKSDLNHHFTRFHSSMQKTPARKWKRFSNVFFFHSWLLLGCQHSCDHFRQI